jgi:hypothetical protein
LSTFNASAPSADFSSGDFGGELDREPFDARHSFDRLTPILAVHNDDWQNQIGGRNPILCDEPAAPSSLPVSS